MSTLLYSLTALVSALAWLSATGDVISSWIVGSIFTMGVAAVVFIARTEPVEVATKPVLETNDA